MAMHMDVYMASERRRSYDKFKVGAFVRLVRPAPGNLRMAVIEEVDIQLDAGIYICMSNGCHLMVGPHGIEKACLLEFLAEAAQ